MSKKHMGSAPLSSFMAILMAGLLLEAWPAQAQQLELQKAPQSPAFKHWVEMHKPRGVPGPMGGSQEGGQRVRGHIPHPMDLSHIRGPIFTRGAGDPAYPAFYDLRASGLLTPVKDQGQYGTCWSFACIGSLESSLLKAGIGTFDLSEWYPAYFAYKPFNNSLMVAYTPGEVGQGEDPIFDQGGNDFMSTALLARGNGAVAEKTCPYQPGAYRPQPRPLGDLPNGKENVVAPLAETLFLFDEDSSSSAEDVKYAITHYGPVVISMDWEDSNFDTSSNTYRDTAATENDLNHEVCIVGWNDHFGTCSFPAANRPAAPGAWIVRNSWSRTWGNAGYFYLSYDSPLFDGSVFLGGQRSSHETYQYDPLGWCGGRGFGNSSAHCANIFQAHADQRITAVAFYATAANTSYEIDLRNGLTGDPGTGVSPVTAQLAVPQSGSFQTAGYHVVTLDNPMTVSKGEAFAVVLKLTTPGYLYPIPVQEPDPGYSDSSTSHHARGYISADGTTWQDLAPTCQGASVCVKALAENLD